MKTTLVFIWKYAALLVTMTMTTKCCVCACCWVAGLRSGVSSSSSFSRRQQQRRRAWFCLNSKMKPTRRAAFINGNDELSTTTTTTSSTSDVDYSSSPSNHDKNEDWIQQGLLISSFSDGLVPNTAARSVLRQSLLRTLLQEQQAALEMTIRSSVLASPCCGPTNVAALEALQNVDDQLESLNRMMMMMSMSMNNTLTSKDGVDTTEQLWQQYLSNSNKKNSSSKVPLLRVLYIPTAMYALRADSQNTPGKQRQRARADGKKRRDELVQFLLDLFGANDASADDGDNKKTNNNNNDGSIAIQVVTLDWDDGSVKQPEVVMSSSSSNHNKNNPNNDLPPPSSSFSFPTTGQQAMRDWKPHLVYVQGGNTFWLHHCLQKGNWTRDFVQLLCDSSSSSCTTNNKNKNHYHHSTFYIGASAGAILVGSAMQTACWKGWDDPRVVPGRQDYADWEHVPGLNLVGNVAFFPHMEDSWKDIVETKSQELLNNNNSSNIHVCALADHEVCFVDGRKQTRILRAEPQHPPP